MRYVKLVFVVLLVATAAVYTWSWMAPVPQPSVEQLAQTVLTASDLPQKQQAAAELVAVGHAAIPQMTRVLTETDEPEVRAAMVQGLASEWGYDSMPAILAALDDDSLLVRRRADEAALRMICVKADYNPEDPPERRAAAIERYYRGWQQLKDSPVLRLWRERLAKKRSGNGQG